MEKTASEKNDETKKPKEKKEVQQANVKNKFPSKSKECDMGWNID